METHNKIYISVLVLFLTAVYCSCVNTDDMDEEKSLLWNSRSFKLYSRSGFYLTISKNGTVGASYDPKDADTNLIMEAYLFGERRIRRDLYYLIVDEKGYMRTRKRKSKGNLHRKDTLFIEQMDNGYWLWYKNKSTGYILALKSKSPSKDKLKKKTRIPKRETQFLTLLKTKKDHADTRRSTNVETISKRR